MARVGCLHSTCGWLGHAAQPPAEADPFSGVAHPRCQHHILPTSMWETHGDTWHVPYRRMLGHQRVHMDACPPQQKWQRHRLLARRTAAAPASHWWQAQSLPRTALCYSRQREHCQRHTGPSGSWQPPWRRAIAGTTGPDWHRGGTASSHSAAPGAKRPVRGGAGSSSSCGAACGSQPCLEGAKELTCRPA